LNRIRARYGLEADQPYVFAFGAADPRKNTERLIRSWAMLPDRLRRDYALLLVGIHDRVMQEFRTLVKELGLEPKCILHGFADERDISSLISGATVLCYPSLSEGFGLPVLDAFQCETAVLASNTTSLPEVAGDAAVLVDPRDGEAIGRGLQELLENPGLRAELIRRGLSRLATFTWEACADRLARVFSDVCGATS
jgi:glycosyltransferase involved in cell wall biosynthesis